MPQPRPLPRSLAPLPGESLPGFLLRLSCRLNQPPARIAGLTGLAPDRRSGASLPVTLLAGIPELARRTFTFMTRLDAGQATQLGMSAWRERYAPLVIAGPEHAGAGFRRLNSELVLAPVTRYCPDCLAGDGSAIQESFGGPWLKTWHLPVVFACTAHQRLLEHLCPECGRPVRLPRPGTQASLLPAMRAAALHPAQCRTELTPAKGRHTLPGCCEARLDQAGSRRPASPGLAALQDKILSLLEPGGPASVLSAGQPARPSGYFADLHVTGMLACSTWPAARHLSPSEDTAAAIDEHVDSLRRRTADRQQRAPASSTSRVMFGSLPADAAASAGLAHIADRVLAGSAGDVREQLRQLLPASTREVKRTVWARRVTWSSPPCSDGLRDASGPLLRGFTKAAGRPQGRRNAVLGAQRWGPENIPAFLPEDWYTRHFKPIDGVNPMFTRRTAVLRLVQMIAGGSLGEAATFLGIATAPAAFQGRIYSGAGHVHSGARQQPDPLGFETALTALTRELDDPATPLVNYQHRRQALENWCINKGAWTALVGRLPRVPGPPPEVGDRKRQIASVYVWTQVTSGEHYFAPRPIEAAQPPEIQEAWTLRRNTIWHLMHRSHPGPHYTGLKAELSIIATSLARTIDAEPLHLKAPPQEGIAGLEIPWPDTSRAPIVLGMVDAEILAYYEHGLERDRLASGRQRIEFLRIWDLLERCLPAAPARVVDVGGGAGVYAIPLASAGYEVHLIDPVPLHVEQAATASRKAGNALARISAGDARDLPEADGSADAVLLLGPIYHLTSREDRLAALREARRVLRPGGIVVAKALSRFYPVFEELAGGMPASPEGLDGTARFLADGQYRNSGGDPANFTTSCFHRPEELADEVKDAGLQLRQLVAASGSVKLLPGLSQLLDVPEGRDHVLSVLRLLEAEPSLIGMSQNFVAIAQAPAGD